MARILVAEDSPTQALTLRRLLESAGHSVAVAKNGREALSALTHGPSDLVLTDLQMPEMDGLQLVREVRRHHPQIPVILMSAHGSEDIAAEALRRGAASYVPKRYMARDMIPTVENILTLTGKVKTQRRTPECWARTESHYLLENDVAQITGLVAHLAENALEMKLCDETGLIRINVALSEALSNAILHGNLELDSALREDDESRYDELARTRRECSPYCERRVYVTEREDAKGVTYVIRDDGPGYNPALLPDPNDPANLERASGRGLLLIRTFMDEVSHSARGNEIAMFKRREA